VERGAAALGALGRLPPSNKRLKLPGALKYGRIPLVRQLSPENRMSLRCADMLCARSLSAIR